MARTNKTFFNGVNLVDVAEEMDRLRVGFYHDDIYCKYDIAGLYWKDGFDMIDYRGTECIVGASYKDQVLFILLIATIIGHNG